ncbi:MAG: shikimate dehydrogenase [Armatimonadetes bacterium]|nr:shikimate dehydrogenase [Armatimonadota bacterium]
MSDWYEWREAPAARYAVVGDPVSHSLSPAMQNAAFRALGMDDLYVAVRVPLEEFDEAMAHLASLGYLGVNVTVPLKAAAFSWAREMPNLERRMGVVNTLRLEGRAAINTDAPGFLSTISDCAIDTPCDVLLLGAGGTARALAVVLEDAGYSLRCWNRTRAKIEALVGELGLEARIVDEPKAAGCPLIVNATSASMSGVCPPVLWDGVPEDAVAIDVFYSDGPTVFERAAKMSGVGTTMDGRRLLVAQGVLAFTWWTGKAPPVLAMLKAVE